MRIEQYRQCCQIIEANPDETVNVKETFNALRLFCAQAVNDINARLSNLSKKEVINIFATIILNSMALSLACEVASREQKAIVYEIVKENEIIDLKVENKQKQSKKN